MAIERSRTEFRLGLKNWPEIFLRLKHLSSNFSWILTRTNIYLKAIYHYRTNRFQRELEGK